MRILFLNPSGAIGGAERVLLNLIECLRRLHPNWETHVLAGEVGPLLGEAISAGASTARALPFPKSIRRLGDSAAGGPAGEESRWALAARAASTLPALPRYLLQLRNVLQAFKPDIVHSNGIKMHLLAAAIKPVGSRLVWHMHDYPSMRPLASRLLRHYSSRADLLIANSESVADDSRWVVGQRVPVQTVKNGVDLDRNAPEGRRLDLDSLSGLQPAPSGTVRVGLVATFARWKGHDLFIEAATRVPASLPIRFYIIGGAVYATSGSQWTIEELKIRASKLLAEKRLGFTGFVNDCASAVRALDIVVHASTKPEPFGLTIVEAMACGKAVVTTAAGGAAEIIQGLGVRVVGPDALQLAREIEALADNPRARQLVGSQSRIEAERRYDRGTMTALIARAWTEMAVD